MMIPEAALSLSATEMTLYAFVATNVLLTGAFIINRGVAKLVKSKAD
ncbi:MAG: hypothetical protein AAFW81_10815 [Pseudomonadota bacterium]